MKSTKKSTTKSKVKKQAAAEPEFELSVQQMIESALVLIKSADEKNIASAFQILGKVCENDTSMSLAFGSRGLTQSMKGDYQKALDLFNKAIGMIKDVQGDPAILALNYNFAGLQHLQLGQLEEAYTQFNVASDYDNQQGFYFFNMALAQFRMEKYEDAIWNYQLAADLLQDYDMRREAKENILVCQKRQLGEIVD